MKTKDLEALKHALEEFANDRDWNQFHTPKNLAMAVAIEAGELLERFQWMSDADSQSIPQEKLEGIGEEIADVLIYLIRLSDKLGIDPLDAATRKIEHNAKRYPADKVKGSAKKYNEYD